MSNEWTIERLDALPEGVVIWAHYRGYSPLRSLRTGDTGRLAWTDEAGDHHSSAEVIECARPGSIRVVSVPIDALLNPAPASVGLGRIDPTSEGALMVIRAAIAHVTGETP